MENTIENKAKFFAQYFDQYVHCNNRIPDEPFWVTGVTMQELSENDFIRLTSLSDITDEDAAELDFFGALNFKSCVESYGLQKVINQHITHYGIDYLRSCGYALPWMGVSVEEQEKRGWIKLKTK